jgi:hypothetical protein
VLSDERPNALITVPTYEIHQYECALFFKQPQAWFPFRRRWRPEPRAENENARM